MRNDIKFGLTIGGLLVFILIIWVGVVNRGAKPSSNSDIKIVDNGPGADSSAVSSATPVVTPAVPAPITTVTPPADSVATITTVTPPAAASVHTDAGVNSVAPADTDSAAVSSAQHDWSKLLSDGQDATPLTAAPSNTTASNTGLVTAADTHVSNVPDMLSDSTPLTAAPATRPSIRTHTIQEGETFSTISAAVYGSSRYYQRLIDANPGVNPNRLKIGQVIQIPDLTASASAAPAVAASISAATASAAPIDPTRSYRVESGDTLERIARKLYGDGQYWEKIYDLNKDQIGANPGRLTLNMVLRLPSPPTAAAAPVATAN